MRRRKGRLGRERSRKRKKEEAEREEKEEGERRGRNSYPKFYFPLPDYLSK